MYAVVLPRFSIGFISLYHLGKDLVPFVDRRRAFRKENRLNGGPDGAPSVNHIVNQEHRLIVQIGSDIGRVDAGRLTEQTEIVPVEGDVQRADCRAAAFNARGCPWKKRK